MAPPPVTNPISILAQADQRLQAQLSKIPTTKRGQASATYAGGVLGAGVAWRFTPAWHVSGYATHQRGVGWSYGAGTMFTW